jgi:hypothetical protein
MIVLRAIRRCARGKHRDVSPLVFGISVGVVSSSRYRMEWSHTTKIDLNIDEAGNESGGNEAAPAVFMWGSPGEWFVLALLGKNRISTHFDTWICLYYMYISKISPLSQFW